MELIGYGADVLMESRSNPLRPESGSDDPVDRDIAITDLIAILPYLHGGASSPPGSTREVVHVNGPALLDAFAPKASHRLRSRQYLNISTADELATDYAHRHPLPSFQFPAASGQLVFSGEGDRVA